MTRRYSFGYISDDLIRHFDIVPDILIMAKSMASRLPLSATAARGEIMNPWKPDSQEIASMNELHLSVFKIR